MRSEIQWSHGSYCCHCQISDKVPFVADLKPSGKYVMEDLQGVGGIPAVLKMLMEEGLVDGSCMTVTGKCVSQRLLLFYAVVARPCC